MQEGRPEAYSSCSMTDTQQKHAPIEKETLAVLFGCTKFHHCICGAHDVLIYNDHKPLETIFARELSKAPPRIARMILQLKKYDIAVKWRPGKKMFMPDALSRTPLEDKCSDEEEKLGVEVHAFVAHLPVSKEKYTQLQSHTDTDENLVLLKKILREGWPPRFKDLDVGVRPYWNYKEEITCIDGIVFKGSRIVVPGKMREEMLRLLHFGHLRIEKIRARARQVIFWPGINQEIEKMMKSCIDCQEYQKRNQKEPLLQRNRDEEPWRTVGTDFLEYGGSQWLLLVDDCSNWTELRRLNLANADTTIGAFKNIFAQFGIPVTLISDNGPPFSSWKFKNFVQEWGTDHRTSSPCYPGSKGLAEKAVSIIKNILRKEGEAGLDEGLLSYRACPLSGS